MPMNTAEDIRQKVAENYAAAVTGRKGGCCGPTQSCCGTGRTETTDSQAEAQPQAKAPGAQGDAQAGSQANAQAGSQADAQADAQAGSQADALAQDSAAGSAGDSLRPRANGITALAGYSDDDVAGLPEDAVANSFGCGNPLAFSQVREGDVVLDLGSGAGIDLLLAAKKVGPTGRVIGVDMTDAMIERARANIAEAGATNVEVRKGIIEELPVETGSVDWVISNCVINLSPEKDKVFAEIARVLKPGGRFLISDIVVEDFPAILRKSVTLYSACVGGAISETEYQDGLRQAGLEDVNVHARTVYDAATLKGLVEEELVDHSLLVDVLNCCGITGSLAKYFEGKVWSAKFQGGKPTV